MPAVRRHRSCAQRWAVVVALVALAGCSTQGLALEQPDRVHNLRPAMFSTTSAPSTVSWDAPSLPDGQRYLVLVDQQPMPPGGTIRSLTDDVCRRTPHCPDQTYLKQHYLYLARGNRARVQSFPLGSPFPVDDLADWHQVTVVVVDRHGRRVGEDAWMTRFAVASP
jgi:hypothetical protein